MYHIALRRNRQRANHDYSLVAWLLVNVVHVRLASNETFDILFTVLNSVLETVRSLTLARVFGPIFFVEVDFLVFDTWVLLDFDALIWRINRLNAVVLRWKLGRGVVILLLVVASSHDLLEYHGFRYLIITVYKFLGSLLALLRLG